MSAIATKKRISDKLSYQQRQWIIEDYKAIIEDTESYGYEGVNGHIDEIVADIKEDVEQSFHCEISTNKIISLIRTYGK